MATSDPRRSSRARTTQPQSRPSSTTSSVSGRPDRSSRPFIKTGSPQKSLSTASLASEAPDDSAAITDDSPPPQPRSRRATQAGHTHTHNTLHSTKDDSQEAPSVIVSEIEMLNDGDDIQEDDEAVRCICGDEDYPGTPQDILHQAAKDGFHVDAIFPSIVMEDLAGFFVQCDICKVWQHGACVGLVNDDTLPEEYYCEECKKDYHRIYLSSNGTRRSIYQPESRSRRSRRSSLVKEREHERSPRVREGSKEQKTEKDGVKEPTREGRSGRASSVTLPSKRRSTMNSRDAAYDEEQLRIAIEASKEETQVESVEGNGVARRSKRSRSFSEEKPDIVKRQRTSSRSVSPIEDKSDGEEYSDDAATPRNGTVKKASRNAAVMRSQQQREKAEREEKERMRAEAANKRNGRAERRRTDDSDPSDEVPLAAARPASNRPTSGGSAVSSGTASGTAAGLASGAAAAATAGAAVASLTVTGLTSTAEPTTTAPASSAASPATVSTAATAPTPHASLLAATPRSVPTRLPQPHTQPQPHPSPETPPPTSAPPMSASKSKGGRPTHKKKGRNQYTKEREAREEQQARSRSRDVLDNGQSKSGAGSGAGGGHGSKSGSRAKGGMNSRVTMTEMKRRVTAMFDFISKTQVELAGEDEAEAGGDDRPHPVHASHASKANGHEKDRSAQSAKAAHTAHTAHTNGVKGNQSPVKKAAAEVDNKDDAAKKEFADLSCLEMMDCLTRDIVLWQGQFT